MSFFAELKRRNVFKVAAAYIIVGWLIMQAGDTLAPALHLPDWINSALVFFLILGFPLAMFFAWAFEMTPEGIKKEKDIDRSTSISHVTGRKLDFYVIALLVIALGYFAFDKFVLDPERDTEIALAAQQEAAVKAATEDSVAEQPDEKSIAVLPFVNMSDDASNEYFSDGITEELLNLLAKIPELRVTSRSSAFSFKGQNIDIRTVAKKLNVAHVLEGSVRKAGNRVRITAQLIRADSDVHMWSESYDRELDDIFAIQDEIAKKVVTVLQVQLLGDLPVSTETESEAYSFYLQSRHHIESAGFGGTQQSEDAFRKALEIDPEYAPAWAGLARILWTRANWDQIDLHTGNEEARQAALKALQLDDTLADAWAMLAWIQWVYDWDWNTAEGTARTALLHGPNDARALDVAARVETTLGNFEDALKFALAAVAVDPLNPSVLRTLGLTHWQMKRFDLAEGMFQRVLELYPDREFARASVAIYVTLQGRPEKAWELLQTEKSGGFKTAVSILVLHDLDKPEKAKMAIQHTIDNESSWLAYQIAEFVAYTGDIDAAFHWLEISYEQRDGGITYVMGDPFLEGLHDDPRWEPYLLKVGLLDAWKALQARTKGEAR